MNAPPLPSQQWSRARKLVAATAISILFVLLWATAAHLSVVFFLLMHKSSPTAVRPLDLIVYWQHYGPERHFRPSLTTATVGAHVLMLGVVPLLLMHTARPRRKLHGDARFATRAEIARAGLLPNVLTWHRPRSPAILVGAYRGQFLSLPGQLSVLLSAPTRSGKGVGVVIPNLLNWPDSVVVLDIKGENYELTAGYRAECGQAVYAFRPFDEEARSHRWNPLGAVRTHPLHRVGDLLAIAQVFFPNDGTGTSSEAFFNDQARNLFLGLGLVLLETTALPRTIGEMLRQSSGKGVSLKDHLQRLVDRRPPEGPRLSTECVDALQRLLSNSENTLSSIVATFNAPLTLFADPIVDAATSADDFRLDDVRRRQMSVYVCVPPHRLASARPLLNLFFSQLVNCNTQTLPEQDRTLRHQCLLINDEFTAMGRVGIIVSAAAFLAGYNLRLLTIVQAMSQLDAVYGDKEARTFATNHGLQILYAPREQRDADEYSAMLGHFTESATSRGTSRSFSQHGHRSVSRNESEQRRALLLPQEIKELGADRLVILHENCKPILADKIRYHRLKRFRQRLRQSPQVRPIDMACHMARVQQRWRYIDGEDLLPDDFNADSLAFDLDVATERLDGPADLVASALLDMFTEPDGHAQREVAGTIEPVIPGVEARPLSL
ncbi:type IV secretory system conjugative DNA transfer family protein [Piscinibacter sp. HJYY11]|uniref:type IV secretory system conjugative DNA transfer family protein n=1 Tax=Piscinibacter sp. HJYY11 TaxID=2801333 RepID=UPI00191EB837|nr:type IV secretory system conjugative DNA transfer family protein [Piscinibacter sp. HJYY11]MBL0726117.1 type IV secretory system conjugative DNA transfer family protein [Piscinibacter sp. HJYY11]